jgi:hypothetical protein
LVEGLGFLAGAAVLVGVAPFVAPMVVVGKEALLLEVVDDLVGRGVPAFSMAKVIQYLLSQLQTSEHALFAAHLYRSQREFRSAYQRAGKSGKQIGRCVISTFQVAEGMGLGAISGSGRSCCGFAIEHCGSLFVQRNSAKEAAA